jgi:putative transposase
MRKSYPTDLTDAEWNRLKSCFPPSKLRGRPRVHGLREIFNAIFYVVRSGCAWRLLPRDFAPWQTVYYHFRRFRMEGLWHLVLKALRRTTRQQAGKHPEPSAAIMDTQSIKTTVESAKYSGYDGHKKVKGRKRHLLVDTLGLLISVYVTSANVQDRVGARCLLAGRKPLMPCLQKVWAYGAYSGEKLARWFREEGDWELEIVERVEDAEGFAVVARRWVVERSLGWLLRNRRLSRDYERKVQTSEAFIEVAMIRLILRRLAITA